MRWKLEVLYSFEKTALKKLAISGFNLLLSRESQSLDIDIYAMPWHPAQNGFKFPTGLS